MIDGVDQDLEPAAFVREQLERGCWLRTLDRSSSAVAPIDVARALEPLPVHPATEVHQSARPFDQRREHTREGVDRNAGVALLRRCATLSRIRADVGRRSGASRRRSYGSALTRPSG
jgi:hypothetical protein